MRKPVFIFLALALSAFAAFAQKRLSIRIAVESKVEDNLLRLGDVARIDGAGEKAERLRSISLGFAPNVGMTREIPREKINLALSAAGFAADDYALDAPPLIRIKRVGQEISRAQMRQAVEKAVFSRLDAETTEARIVRLDLPETITVPKGKIEVRANLSSAQNIFAPAAVSIEIRVNDAAVRRLPVNLEIEAFAEILVAARDLTVEGKVDESSFRMEKRRLERPLASYLRDATKLRGIKFIKNLPAGSPISIDAFVGSVVVRAGDLVRIVGQSGKLQIAVSGEARTSGKIGDRIAVKNSQSNLVIQATVMDEGLVKVFF